jgi:hypothetical protein
MLSTSALPVRRPRVFATLLLLLAILLLAACTGAAAAPSGVASLQDPAASGSPGSSVAPSSSLSPEDAMLAFARCMREHGVDMPDPQVGEGGFAVRIDGGKTEPATFEAAQEACGSIMEQAGRGPGRSMSPEDLDAMVAFAQCMRDHGIDMPDPQTDGGGLIIRGSGRGGSGDSGGKDSIDPSSSEFQDAMEACQELMPGGGPQGGDGPSVNTSGG